MTRCVIKWTDWTSYLCRDIRPEPQKQEGYRETSLWTWLTHMHSGTGSTPTRTNWLDQSPSGIVIQLNLTVHTAGQQGHPDFLHQHRLSALYHWTPSESGRKLHKSWLMSVTRQLDSAGVSVKSSRGCNHSWKCYSLNRQKESQLVKWELPQESYSTWRTLMPVSHSVWPSPWNICLTLLLLPWPLWC